MAAALRGAAAAALSSVQSQLPAHRTAERMGNHGGRWIVYTTTGFITTQHILTIPRVVARLASVAIPVIPRGS